MQKHFLKIGVVYACMFLVLPVRAQEPPAASPTIGVPGRQSQREERQNQREERLDARENRQTQRMDRQVERQEQVQERKETREALREERQAERSDRQELRQEKASTSAERRSRVASAVQELLTLRTSNEGIGVQVRDIAQAQNEDVAKLEEKLQAVQKRGVVLRVLFGPDRAGLAEAKSLIQQNSQRVERLERLRSELTTQDPESAQKLQQQIQELQQVNADFNQTVVQSEQGFSLFGWALRLFGR